MDKVLVLTLMKSEMHTDLVALMREDLPYVEWEHCLTEDDAKQKLRSSFAAVVVVDNDHIGEHWPGLFGGLRTINQKPPCLLVAHHTASEEFWRKVLGLGAEKADLVATPFRREDMYPLKVLVLYWLQRYCPKL